MSPQPEAIDPDKLRAYRRLLERCMPEECAQRVTSLLEHHDNYGRDAMLAIARKAATPEQRKALADSPDRQASRRGAGTKS